MQRRNLVDRLTAGAAVVAVGPVAVAAIVALTRALVVVVGIAHVIASWNEKFG